jgi:ArsR family transcriptional regulator
MSLMVKAVPSARRAKSAACCPRPSKLRPRATKSYAQLLKALGDETRLEMVGLLAAQGDELCVCDIESHFDIGQPTISHHLRLLREAGVVSAERRGTWVYYSLASDLVPKLKSFYALLAA